MTKTSYHGHSLAKSCTGAFDVESGLRRAPLLKERVIDELSLVTTRVGPGLI
jgi:hypothetical protein